MAIIFVIIGIILFILVAIIDREKYEFGDLVATFIFGMIVSLGVAILSFPSENRIETKQLPQVDTVITYSAEKTDTLYIFNFQK